MLDKWKGAIRAFAAYRRDPENIDNAVHQIDAWAEVFGRGDETMRRRMRATPEGRRLVDERHPILSRLTDREALAAMPDGSVGRTYLQFTESRGIDPAELAKIVQKARRESGGFVPNASPEVAYLHDRFRDMHDLFHVLTGYDTDMGGEFGLHGFQNQQNGYRAMNVGVFVACIPLAFKGRPDLIMTFLEGRRRGRRAEYILGQDWDGLLSRPLGEIREQLRLTPLPEYRPFSYAELGDPSPTPSA
jgi:ubiquinone biosynthesis protein COQ4